MDLPGKKLTDIALLAWNPADGIARMIQHELIRLGHLATVFYPGEEPPLDVDIILSHGPHGPLLPIWQAIAARPGRERVKVVHWNTEGLPDLRIPVRLVKSLAALRSRAEWRLAAQGGSGMVDRGWLHALLSDRMHRFRYLGDYDDAYRRGWLDVLADTSDIYVDHHQRRGIPSLYAPWGSSPLNFADLGLDRDIDVLWMGNRGSRRRARAMRAVVTELRRRGRNVHVADNEESPFIFDDTRTEYLNRAKITLNLTRAWYDDNYSRFALAIPNRSLVVSEPILPHCLELVPGRHFIMAAVQDLPDVICYYLDHAAERQAIVQRAYDQVDRALQLGQSMDRLICATLSERPAA